MFLRMKFQRRKVNWQLKKISTLFFFLPRGEETVDKWGRGQVGKGLNPNRKTNDENKSDFFSLTKKRVQQKQKQFLFFARGGAGGGGIQTKKNRNIPQKQYLTFKIHRRWKTREFLGLHITWHYIQVYAERECAKKKTICCISNLKKKGFQFSQRLSLLEFFQ